MKVLIGGGSGFVGHHLSSLLRNKGYSVTLISRTRGENKITWDDLHNQGLPDDLDAVVNLAGENLMNPMKRWNNDFKTSLVSSRIETTKQLVHSITDTKASKPKVWISASAIGFYPPSSKAVYTEESPGGKGDFFAELCDQWEKAASLPSTVSGVRQVVVRIGLALGRDGGTIQSMFMPFFLGVGGPIGSGKQWFPWIHVDDVAGIIAHAIEKDGVSGPLNAVAPCLSTNAEFTAAFAKAMWRPAAIPVPSFALQLLFGSERARIMLEGQKVVPKRTLESGYRFLYPDLTSACREFSRLIKIAEMK